MELRIQKADLVAAMAKCAPVASRRSTLPVLSHVHVSVGNKDSDGGVVAVFTATDLEVGVRVQVPVESEGPGVFVLPGRKLAEVARELPAGDVMVGGNGDGRSIISAGACRFQLSSLAGEDFPEWGSVIGEVVPGEWRVDAGRFVEMIDAVLFCANADTSRYNLNAVSVEFGNGDDGQSIPVRFVATDGHRLGSVILSGAGNGLSGMVLIPRSGMTELRRVANGVDGEVVVRRTDKNVILETGDGSTLVAVRLLDGDYPAYERVIPTKYLCRFVVGREELLGALKRVSVMSSDRMRGVNVDLYASGVLVVEIQHSDLGDARDEIGVAIDGGTVAGDDGSSLWQAILNVEYLTEAVNSIRSDEVVVDISTVGAVVFRPSVVDGADVGELSQFCIVMPMRK